MQQAATEHDRPSCPQCGYLAETAGAVNFCPKCGHDLRAAPGERTLTNAWLNQVIADRYRLLSLLGEGGMGAVYKAEHIRMGKALALKILRGDFAREPGAVARFRSEAQIVSRLSHPHTIAVFDFGEIGEADGFYLAMEYVPGKDLAHVLREQGRITDVRAAEIGQQILGSLAEAHDAGIVHRDMKPGNVMLMQTRSGEDFVKVLDFGIAKLRDEHESSTTSAGAIVGTPNYLSPEQARGDSPDARTDLYSLGCVLYELVAGRPPFVAPNPLAVVSAHLHQAPQPLGEVAPGVSQEYAAVVHRALAKNPADRFGSADEMRDALLRLGEPSIPRRENPTVPELTGELQIANRDDFADFERQLRALKRARIAAPVTVAVLLALGGLVFWRWPDVYGFLDDRFPSIAEALPASFRPADLYDGVEHEPNDSPAQANPLPIPPGPDGRRGGGTAVMRGHIGAKLNDSTGDVDVFRIEVPPTGGRSVLVADWSGEKEGEGIRGLDVALTLNRQRPGADRRSSAPLVANVDRGGPGRPETLAAAVEPGTYYLAVRERHRDDTGPVEKPTDWYVLSVRLTAPRPGEEIEPNDAPDSVEHRELRYPEWRTVAERNPLGEGTVVHGTTSREDPDNYAVAPHGPAEAPELIAVIPEPGLALGAQLWVPDQLDLAPGKTKDRVRFEPAGETPPGQVLFLHLPSAPRAGAPDLVQLRATSGEGRYQIVALGQASTSGAAVVSLVEELASAGHTSQALELAAGFVKHLPGSPARTDVLLSAGQVAERAAGKLRASDVSHFRRASQLLGADIFGLAGGSVRYLGAFDAAVAGNGRLAEQAAVRLVSRAAPCTPEDVALRAVAFLVKYPGSQYAQEARLWQARALEDQYWRGGGRDQRLLDRALGAYRTAAELKGDGTAEAEERIRRLGGRRPNRTGAPRVCR
jgi:serine/threonine-protein kinase